MAEPKPKHNKSRIFQKLMPWVISTGILIYLLNTIPITDVYAASADVNLWAFIPLIFLGNVLYILWDVLVFILLFKKINLFISYRDMLVVRAAILLPNMVNYFLGAGSVALVVNRWKNIPISKTGSVVFFKLFIEYHAVVALCLAAAFHIPGIDLNLLLKDSDIGNYIRFIVLSWVVFGAILLFFHLVLPRVNGLMNIKNSNLLSMFRNVKPVQQVFFITMQTTGFFFFDILIAYCALSIFGLKIEALYFIAFFPIVRLIESIPVSVMGLGTGQLAMLWMLTPIVDSSADKSSLVASILAFSLLITLCSNLSRFVIGVIGIKCLPADIWKST